MPLIFQEVVDCPEFLVYFPALEKLAERFGLMLIGKQKFANYFKVKYTHFLKIKIHFKFLYYCVGTYAVKLEDLSFASLLMYDKEK